MLWPPPPAASDASSMLRFRRPLTCMCTFSDEPQGAARRPLSAAADLNCPLRAARRATPHDSEPDPAPLSARFASATR